MAWLELHITTTSDHADALGEQLTELGAQALTLRDAGNAPVYEPAPGETPTWQSTTLVGLFDDTQDMSAVMKLMSAKLAAGVLQDFRLETLPDQPWERTCLQDFKPLRFGKRLCICPSWETPPEDDCVNVILDPGLAFGTGTSPTTALCLEWLDQNVQNGDTVIDYGCGSGILALAALKLGAKQVFAVDYDPQALLATRDNGERNQLMPPELEVFLPDDFVGREVDIVVANILAKSLIELAPYLASLAKPKGRILLSGILITQAEAVLEVYREWFTMPEPTSKEEWVRLEGIRK
ncbi:MAG: 50S ribosomal protein L11 methyltransferase [Gammaproteobacteria bacterium]|nr:50S ribosomal protein L11 methyltransferase [Gammaproteobacteria bacterium]